MVASAQRIWRRVRLLCSGDGTDAGAAGSVPPSRRHNAGQPESAGQRLRRLAGWCVSGRLAGAELELYDWHRHDPCPGAARVLLASLMARQGRMQDALVVLRRKRRKPAQVRDTDPVAEQMLVTVLMGAEMDNAARQIALRLYSRFMHDPSVVAWVELMQVLGPGPLRSVQDTVAEQLAGELTNGLDLIPSLVAAQRVAPSPQAVTLLRKAIYRVASTERPNEQRLMVCQALAELAVLGDDPADARKWAHRGLKIDPYSAPLALVLNRVSDDLAEGLTATQVLTQAADWHPEYADLQAILIRRVWRQGDAQTAKQRLALWLNRQPNHPLAQKIEQELAA